MSDDRPVHNRFDGTKPKGSREHGEALARGQRSATLRSFVGFVGVGIGATGVTLVARFVGSLLLPFELAVAMAHVIGTLFSFALNRSLIFQPSQGSAANDLGRFLLVSVMALTITTATSSFALNSWLPAMGIATHTELIAHAIGLGFSVFPTFLAHKLFTFRRRNHAAGVTT